MCGAGFKEQSPDSGRPHGGALVQYRLDSETMIPTNILLLEHRTERTKSNGSLFMAVSVTVPSHAGAQGSKCRGFRCELTDACRRMPRNGNVNFALAFARGPSQAAVGKLHGLDIVAVSTANSPCADRIAIAALTDGALMSSYFDLRAWLSE